MADDIVLGAKQIPNPKGITPKLDTDNPDVEKPQYAKMDIHNPPTSHAVVPSHPIEDAFTMHGIDKNAPRHPFGHYVPKSHPVVSEN